jgi:uncharacterized protein YjdB
MKKIILIFLFAKISSSLFAQTPLTISGQVINSTLIGSWEGYNVPRNQPTTFTFKNNSITSVNVAGYMLQAGDENPAGTNNNLDGEIITGNKFTWNGNDAASITHGVFTGYNKNVILKYNYLNKVPMGLLRKSNGMTNTSGGVAYNIVVNSLTACVAKGINNVNVYNNTFYSTKTAAETWRGLVDIYTNTDFGLSAPSTGTKVYNNIFYTKYQIYNIYVYEAACLTGFESDYNVFYCESGTPVFNYLGSSKTFAQWQALGYDTHSVVINPNFLNFTDFVPAVRLDYGTNLGATWQKGLAVDAVWSTADPTTADQNDTWQVGARIYSSQMVPVTGISVSGAGGSTSISTDNGTLQLSASVLPSNATDKTVTWSIENGSGEATISTTGLVTAVDNGTVTAKATARDGSGVVGLLIITLSNQIVPVSGITVTGASGATIITTDNGTLQLSAAIMPANATNKTVTWTIVNGTGEATINSTGVVSAVNNGTVTARATANDNSGVSGALVITISNQIIPVTGVTVTGAGGATTITTDNGTLQMSAAVVPANATDKTVTWSVVNGTGHAVINSTGLVTAVENGTVSVIATANDGSTVSGTLVITLSNQVVSVTAISVSGEGGATTISTDNGTLQLSASVIPANATDKTVTWSIVNGTGQATINSSGLVTATDNGTVTARASSNESPGVSGTLVITITNQIVPVTGINVTGTGGVSTITTDNGTLQMNAEILPANATDKTVTWSVVNGTGQATINSTGSVTAVDNGTVTVRATANDGSEVSGTLVITISNQIVPVTGIIVTGAGGLTSISTNNGTLQLNAAVSPANSTNKTVAWSIINGTGEATINATGLVTALNNGTVTARATANDGSGVIGNLVITISNQIISVTSISVTGAGGARIITTVNGSLQLSASVLPENATIKTVIWSLINGTGQATINAAGLVTAVADGTVTAQATANDGSGVTGILVITINSSMIPVTNITITGAGGVNTISSDKGILQLSEAVLPGNASDNSVTWSIINGTGEATINSTGLVTAIANGSVTAIATANDGTGVYGTFLINISNQIVLVSTIIVSGAGGLTSIISDNGTLQLSAEVLPANSTDKTVTWSIVNGTGQATISPTGLVTGVDNGTVTARASANDGSAITGTLVITLSNQVVPVTSINVTGAGNATTISTDNGTLQLNAEVLPANATNKNVSWSVINGTGQASVSSTGLVTATDNGIVTVRATADDGTDVSGTLVITISNQLIPVTGIIVTGAGGATVISSDNGTLQLIATVLPANATSKTITWSIVNGSGQAIINTSGLVTAVDNGTVTARATSIDGSGVYGTIVITISSQIVPVTSISVSGAGGATSITADNGSLQMNADVFPANATVNTVTWSLVNGTGQATINATGRMTAVDNGTVTVMATANDGSGVSGTLDISISNQSIQVTGISVTGAGGVSVISADNGSLQLSAAILPLNATDKTVTWSVINGTGQATVNSGGLVTAVDNGTVTARATANDGSGIYGTIMITILNQVISVTGINITGAGGASIITTNDGSLQLSASVLPANATDKTVIWSLANGTGQATISSNGLVTAIENGTVTARATANDGSGISGSLLITIFNQKTPVTSITVTGSGGLTTITSDNGSLQLIASILPLSATDKSVTWSIVTGLGLASISALGLLTAFDNGSVTVMATANDGSGVNGIIVINISNQAGPVTSISVAAEGGATTISTDNGSLQLNAAILPANATVKTVSWSFAGGTGQATINAYGFVTAVDNGTVIVKATANDGSGVFGTMVITISNQIVPVKEISVSGENNETTISIDNGSLQLIATVLPENAIDKTVTWSLADGIGLAGISSTGLLTAIENGTVTARATAKDGSGVYGTLVIIITNQIVTVTGITITGEGGITSITNDDGLLQLRADILPDNATDKTILWSIVNGTGKATINSQGLVTAVRNGIVTVKATANDGSGVFGSINIPIAIEKIKFLSMTVTRDEIKVLLNDDYVSWKAGLYNMQGCLVLSKLVESDIFVFDISALPSGIYILVLSKGDNIKVAKVIKP